MAAETKQRVLLEVLTDKPVCVEFTAPEQTSDGGVFLLKAIGSGVGLTERMAGAIGDPREGGKVCGWVLAQLRISRTGARGFPGTRALCRNGLVC